MRRRPVRAAGSRPLARTGRPHTRSIEQSSDHPMRFHPVRTDSRSGPLREGAAARSAAGGVFRAAHGHFHLPFVDNCGHWEFVDNSKPVHVFHAFHGIFLAALLALPAVVQAGPLVEGVVERSETGGVSPPVSLWSPSTPYKTRLDFVHSLGRDLSPAQVDGLLAYLSAPDPSLRPDREAALKNDVWNLLREQTVLPTNLVPTTIAVFRAHEQAPAILDYCIQHLGAVALRVEDAGSLRDLRECLEEASRENARPYSGTALIALTHVPAPGNADRTFLLARTLALAAHPAARATALQIGAEQGFSGVLPHVRAILADSAHPATLHISALAALGALGDAADLARLDAFAAAHPHPRFRPALSAARARLQKTLSNVPDNP